MPEPCFGIDNPTGITDADYDDDASIRSSVGGSILWASPFGLLRADFRVSGNQRRLR